MPGENRYVAHVELIDGTQSSFLVDATSLREAHTIALEQMDDGEILRGVALHDAA
jgi:hypothetical protein